MGRNNSQNQQSNEVVTAATAATAALAATSKTPFLTAFKITLGIAVAQLLVFMLVMGGIVGTIGLGIYLLVK